ncbi:hypothetical protein MVEN_01663400 [Mycena venus]|uniref:F-box domain-containing protein n=1 Tax=Mycena venus TaxID=2733690 RepID=A0A8H6XR86_9AGAR|nr:hypothetical protein MVEN_01663400 [Mycena venus]
MASASSPVRRVPPEMVCEIFALTLSCKDDRMDKTPWQLGHICQSWRLAALGYPPLWNSITIPSPRDSFLLPMIETQLLRSASGPLNVYWSADEEEGTADPQCAASVVSHCNRWHLVCLDTTYTSDELSWLHPAAGRLDALERLKVLGSDPTVGIRDIFSVAPRLREVILTDFRLGRYSAQIDLPWGQITHYRGAFIAQTQIDILKQTPYLRQCAVGLKLHIDYDPDNNSPAVLPYLRRLCIGQPRLLDRLNTPLLEELSCVRNWRMDLRALLPFVHSSSCSLKTLVLMSCGICPDLVEVLRGLPSLTYAFIESPDERHGETAGQYEHTVALFEAMTTKDLCPALTSFVFGMAPEFPQDVFFTMVQSRTKSNPLNYLRLFGYDNSALDPSSLSSIRGYSTMTRPLPSLPALEVCPSTMMDPIQALREEGFDIAFVGGRDVDLLKEKWLFV